MMPSPSRACTRCMMLAALRAQFVQSGGAGAPVCKFIQPLPGNQYKIILTRAQLERVIAEHYGVKT